MSLFTKQLGLAAYFLQFTFLGITLFPLLAQSKISPKAEIASEKTKPLFKYMDETANLIFELQKYSTSLETFNNPKNQKAISKILSGLEKKSLNISKHTDTSTTAYRLSSEALTKHLRELNRLYNNGSRVYARWMSLSTPQLCASCHSQLPDRASHLWNLQEKDLIGTTIERADLLFSTWNYDGALKKYDELIRNYPSKLSSDPLELERALNKKLATFLRVKREIKNALSSFETDLLNKKLPESVVEKLKNWIVAIKNIEKTDKESKEMLEPKNLLKFISKTYSKSTHDEKDAPTKVYASGLLYEALHLHSDDEYTPQFLYWLGTSNQEQNRDFFFGLSQNYLRECVVKYPKHPIAKKCYEEYANEERLQWTGTRGYDPPAGLEKDLKALLDKVNVTKK